MCQVCLKKSKAVTVWWKWMEGEGKRRKWLEQEVRCWGRECLVGYGKHLGFYCNCDGTRSDQYTVYIHNDQFNYWPSKSGYLVTSPCYLVTCVQHYISLPGFGNTKISCTNGFKFLLEKQQSNQLIPNIHHVLAMCQAYLQVFSFNAVAHVVLTKAYNQLLSPFCRWGSWGHSLPPLTSEKKESEINVLPLRFKVQRACRANIMPNQENAATGFALEGRCHLLSVMVATLPLLLVLLFPHPWNGVRRGIPPIG